MHIMVKSVLGLLRCVTFVTPNPSPRISWCKWQKRQGHPTAPLSFKNVGFPGTVPWTILKSLHRIWKGTSMENHHFHHFFRLQSFEGLSVRSESSCFLALLPKAIGWITQASKDRETHRKRRRLGELGWWARWLVGSRMKAAGGSPKAWFPAVFSLVNQEGLVFADPLWW